MTEMMDMSSDLVGSGIPFLDYKMYAERIFFPGHRESPLRRDLDVQDCRRATVEQGLVQLSNLLNSKLFLTKVHNLMLVLWGKESCWRKKKKKDFSFILLLKQSYFIIVKYIQVHILSKNHLTNWFTLLKLLGCTSVTYLKAYYSLFTNRSGTESYAVTRVRNVGLNGFKGILHLSGPCVMLFPFESSLLSALCSLSTLWRARGHSLPETEPTWPLCSL